MTEADLIFVTETTSVQRPPFNKNLYLLIFKSSPVRAIKSLLGENSLQVVYEIRTKYVEDL